LFVILTVTLMPTCPGWVPAAVDDGVNFATLVTLAWILSLHCALWSAPIGTVPLVDRLPPPVPPVPFVDPPNVGWVVWLAAGLVCDTAITVTAMRPPQMTSTMTTMSVMISPVFRFGGGGGGG